jgi:hypothetical protein
VDDSIERAKKALETVSFARPYAAIPHEDVDKFLEAIDILKSLVWKSTDKDNMEYRCDTTYYIHDRIRKLLDD